MAVAQDSTGAVVRWHTPVRAFCTLYNPVQPPTRWNFKRTSSARRRKCFHTNIYFSPHRSGYYPNNQSDHSWLGQLPKVSGLVCGDINAHHSSWDDYVSTNPRGSALHDWMKAHSKVVISDGSPTRAARGEQSAGISTADVTLVDTVIAHRFSWETIPERGSDHLPFLLILNNDIKVERVHIRRRPNYPNADWLLFHKYLDNSIHAVLSVGSLSKR